jgi:hypothetical protein
VKSPFASRRRCLGFLGLAQLGVIAGCGMLIAYLESLTLLPALIHAVKPPPEPKPLTFQRLAPADAFLRHHRFLVVAVTALVVIAGLPALTRLQFDFNPLNLRDRNSQAMSTTLLWRYRREQIMAPAHGPAMAPTALPDAPPQCKRRLSKPVEIQTSARQVGRFTSAAASGAAAGLVADR